MRSVAILGGADCVWEDAAYLMDLYGGEFPGDWMTVNDIGCHWRGRINVWATLHPEKLVEEDPDHPNGLSWMEQRHRAHHTGGYTTYSNREPKLVHETILHWGGGSSGLFAVAVAYEIGYKRVVLCGVPMTKTGHFDGSLTHPGDDDWEYADDHWKAWDRKLRKGDDRSRFLQNNVRSMSGRTRRVLGEPTREWIDEAL